MECYSESCCVLYTHSRAAKKPLAASLPATPALGHRRCLSAFTVFRGAANDPELFSVADRQDKNAASLSKQRRCMFPRFCTPSHMLPRKGLQQPHQQSRQDTSATNPRIPPLHQDQHFHQNGFRPDTGKNRPAGSHQARRDRTRHSAKCPRPHLLRFGATEPDNPQRPKDQFDNVGKADKDSTWFVNI